MRFAVSLGWCGYLLDFSVGPAEDDEESELVFEAGSYTSTPVGFAPNVMPQWDDQGSYHTLDPGDDE